MDGRDFGIRSGAAAAAALAAVLAGPAQADVLEIDAGTARWIAGPKVAVSAPLSDGSDGAPAQELAASHLVGFEAGELPADFAIPPQALVDAARSAGMVPAAYAAKVLELARRFDLSPALIEALVWQESRWNSTARSPVGARGLAQLMPATARELGVNPDDPFANLEGGARYLRQQLDRFDGDLERALAAYNAGPGRVIAAGGIPRIRETQLYVAAIIGRLASHHRN